MAQYILILILTIIIGIYAAIATFGMNHPSLVLKYNHTGKISYEIKAAQTDDISSNMIGHFAVDQFDAFKKYPNYDYYL